MTYSKTVQFNELGTEIFLKIITKEDKINEQAASDLAHAHKIISEKRDIFNRFDEKSELCRLNKSLFRPFKASRDLLEIARKSIGYNRESLGLFDPRIIAVLEKIGYQKDFKKVPSNRPSQHGAKPGKILDQKYEKDIRIRYDTITLEKRVDFGGMVKGWIADQIAIFLRKKGWGNFLIDLGGDIFAAGTNQHGQKWKLAVEGISENLLQLNVSEKGIATSGITRRSWFKQEKFFHHLVNPKKPNYFDSSLYSVTVVDKNTESADVRAKILFLMGQKKGMKFADKNNIACIFLPSSGKPAISKNMELFIN